MGITNTFTGDVDMEKYSAECIRRQDQKFTDDMRARLDGLGIGHDHLSDSDLRIVLYKAVWDLQEMGLEVNLENLLNLWGVRDLRGEAVPA